MFSYPREEEEEEEATEALGRRSHQSIPAPLARLLACYPLCLHVNFGFIDTHRPCELYSAF